MLGTTHVRVGRILLEESRVVRPRLVVALELEVINVRELEPSVGRLVAGWTLIEVTLVLFSRELVVSRIPRLNCVRQRLLGVATASRGRGVAVSSGRVVMRASERT